MKRKINEKKEDFQKTKQKLGKAKQKAVNYTDVSVKTKAISIGQQNIGLDKGEFVTSRNLSFKDLLANIKHYNLNVRKEGIRGLQELLSLYPPLLFVHMSDIVEVLGTLLTDNDESVRLTLYQLTVTILPVVKEEKIRPYLPLLAQYISIALSHIDEYVRFQSLNFVKLFLGSFPELCYLSTDKLINHLIEMLRHPNIPFMSKSDIKQNSAPLRNTLHNMKSRSNILNVLHLLFRTITTQSVYESTDRDEQTRQKFSTLDVEDINKYSTAFHQPQMRAYLNHVSTISKKCTMNDSQLQKLRDSLLPLLLEMWTECKSEISCHSDNIYVLQAAIVVLDVISYIWKMNEEMMKLLRQKYFEDINRLFINLFPLEVEASSSQIGGCMRHLNLQICFIMSRLVKERESLSGSGPGKDIKCDQRQDENSTSVVTPAFFSRAIVDFGKEKKKLNSDELWIEKIEEYLYSVIVLQKKNRGDLFSDEQFELLLACLQILGCSQEVLLTLIKSANRERKNRILLFYLDIYGIVVRDAESQPFILQGLQYASEMIINEFSTKMWMKALTSALNLAKITEIPIALLNAIEPILLSANDALKLEAFFQDLLRLLKNVRMDIQNHEDNCSSRSIAV